MYNTYHKYHSGVECGFSGMTGPRHVPTALVRSGVGLSGAVCCLALCVLLQEKGRVWRPCFAGQKASVEAHVVAQDVATVSSACRQTCRPPGSFLLSEGFVSRSRRASAFFTRVPSPTRQPALLARTRGSSLTTRSTKGA